MSLYAILPLEASIEYKVDKSSLVTEQGIYDFNGIYDISALPSLKCPKAVVIIKDENRAIYNKIKLQLSAKVARVVKVNPDNVNMCMGPQGTPIMVNKHGSPLSEVSPGNEITINSDEILITELQYDSYTCFIYEIIDPIELQWHLDTMSGVMMDFSKDTPYCRFRNSVLTHLLIENLNEKDICIYMVLPMAENDSQLYLQSLSTKYNQWLNMGVPSKDVIDIRWRNDLSLDNLKKQVRTSTLELLSLYNNDLECILGVSMEQFKEKSNETCMLDEEISQLERSYLEHESEIKTLERELRIQDPCNLQSCGNKFRPSHISKEPSTHALKKSTNILLKGMELELENLLKEENELDF